MQFMRQKPIVGLSILRLVQYQDHLGQPEKPKELEYWEQFVSKFFSPDGVLRQQFVDVEKGNDKTYRIEYFSLPRFYQAHFRGGIKQISMSTLQANENNLPTGGHTVFCRTATTTYIYNNDNTVVTSGQVRVNFDADNRIELLDISTTKWVEYIPRRSLQQPEILQDQKQSPKITKTLKRPSKSVPAASSHPSLNIPETKVGGYGIPDALQAFLEVQSLNSPFGASANAYTR